MQRSSKRNGRRVVLGAVGSTAVVLVIAAAAYACTNYVGLVKLYGNRTDSATVTVTGSQSDGEASEAMTQGVSSGTAKADNESTGWFQMWTGPRSNGWKLASGTYDVNWINIGYSNHTTWLNPSGDCMTWTIPTSTNLGTVTINTSGNITGGAGTYYMSYASNWVKFDLPTATANTGSQESGVCISDSGSHDGNQMPLKLI